MMTEASRGYTYIFFQLMSEWTLMTRMIQAVLTSFKITNKYNKRNIRLFFLFSATKNSLTRFIMCFSLQINQILDRRYEIFETEIKLLIFNSSFKAIKHISLHFLKDNLNVFLKACQEHFNLIQSNLFDITDLEDLNKRRGTTATTKSGTTNPSALIATSTPQLTKITNESKSIYYDEPIGQK